MKTKPSPRSRSSVCVKEYRFSGIVGERVLVDWLIDPVPVRRVRAAVMVGSYVTNPRLFDVSPLDYKYESTRFYDSL